MHIMQVKPKKTLDYEKFHLVRFQNSRHIIIFITKRILFSD